MIAPDSSLLGGGVVSVCVQLWVVMGIRGEGLGEGREEAEVSSVNGERGRVRRRPCQTEGSVPWAFGVVFWVPLLSPPEKGNCAGEGEWGKHGGGWIFACSAQGRFSPPLPECYEAPGH